MLACVLTPLCLAGLQVHVRLYVEYPLRPPLLLVKGLKDVPRDRKTAPRTLGSATVNQLAWLEHEVWGGEGCSSITGFISLELQYRELLFTLNPSPNACLAVMVFVAAAVEIFPSFVLPPPGALSNIRWPFLGPMDAACCPD